MPTGHKCKVGSAAHKNEINSGLMSRRTILGIALACLAALTLAIAPWTVNTGRLTAAVARQLRSVYGLDLAVKGRTTIALLPVPRMKFENVALAVPGSPPLVDAEQLRSEFRIWPLLIGRIELAEVALSGAQLRVEEGNDLWSPLWARQRDRLAGRSANRNVRRLIITNSTLNFAGDGDGAARIDILSLVVNWPAVEGKLDATAALRWRGESVQVTVADLHPAVLAKGGKDRLRSRGLDRHEPRRARARCIRGERQGERPRRASRRGRCATFFIGATCKCRSAISSKAPRSPATSPPRTAPCPSRRCSSALGSDKLDGALSSRFEGGRLSLTGTLAAERLNLADTPFPFGPLQASAGYWSYDPLNLRETGGADLDLRISAAAARLGAAAARRRRREPPRQARAGRALRSAARPSTAARSRGGSRSRPANRRTTSSSRARSTASISGRFLTDLGQTRWISGTAQGQVNLEAVGELARRALSPCATGAPSSRVRQGDLWGVAFADALRRIERRPLVGAARMAGRPYRPSSRRSIVLNVHGGVGDVVDATARRVLRRGPCARDGCRSPSASLALKATVEARSLRAPGRRPVPRSCSTSTGRGATFRSLPTRAR